MNFAKQKTPLNEDTGSSSGADSQETGDPSIPAHI